MKSSEYQELIKADIQSTYNNLGCQPVIFAGSGLSKRYFNAPNWNELLDILINKCPVITKKIAYYQQIHRTPEEIGSEIARAYHEWAWDLGRSSFPDELYDSSIDRECFVKYYVAKVIDEITPIDEQLINKSFSLEISALKNIQPHCIITTNYDRFLDMIFPDYSPIIGQKIIKANNAKIGEIFKIHGCVTDHNEIVLTTSDYDSFIEKKKYLSAKLLTYFLEHPVLITGYSVTDRNIRLILQDIDEILAGEGRLVSNIYFLMRDKKKKDDTGHQNEILLDLGNSRSMRVKAIYASDFAWVFKAFNNPTGLMNLNPKILRSLMAHTYDLVRNDIPRMHVQVDYAALEGVVANGQSIGRILGISAINDASMFNAAYPYTLTQVAEKLDLTSWHHAGYIISQIIQDKKIDIKSSDNDYHISVKTGKSYCIHKYSEKAVSLLKDVKDKKPYEVRIKKNKSTK